MRRSRRAQREWAGTLAGGVVVLAAVWALLEALRRAVCDIEQAVDRVWTAGKHLAQQTQAAHLLEATKVKTGELRQAAGGQEGSA